MWWLEGWEWWWEWLCRVCRDLGVQRQQQRSRVCVVSMWLMGQRFRDLKLRGRKLTAWLRHQLCSCTALDTK